MLLLLVTAPLLLPEYRAAQAGRLDLTSVALLLATILPVIWGLKQLATHGVQVVPSLAILVGAAFGVVFVYRQRTLTSPLLDLRLFANRPFTAALGSMFGMTLIGANMLFIAQYFQLVAGLSPLKAGLWMLPAVGGSMLGLLLSPLIARQVRPAYLIGAGLLVAATGFLLLAQASTTSLGSPGAGVYCAQLDGAISANIPAEAAAAARDSLAGATVTAASLADPLGTGLLIAAREAFTSGMHAAAVVSAVVLVGVAILAVTLLRHVRPIGVHLG